MLVLMYAEVSLRTVFGPKIGGKNPEKVFTFILFCFGFVVVVRRMIIN